MPSHQNRRAAKAKAKAKAIPSPTMQNRITASIVESVPEGVFTEYIRARAEILRASGQSTSDALNAALDSSLELFPEVWVYIRALTPVPWGGVDVAFARRTVEEINELREQYRAEGQEAINLRTRIDSAADELRAATDRANYQMAMADDVANPYTALRLAQRGIDDALRALLGEDEEVTSMDQEREAELLDQEAENASMDQEAENEPSEQPKGAGKGFVPFGGRGHKLV